MVVNQFDFIAPFYGRLSRLIFRGEIFKCQTEHLGYIEADDYVLILGGGSGDLLEKIPVCRQIDFVEKSSKMMNYARGKEAIAIIDFHNQDFLSFESKTKYDVIICPFFLDCFDRANLETVIQKIREMLYPKGKLMVADFDSETTPWLLERLMHLFFGIVASLGSSRLQPIRTCLQETGFEEQSLKRFKSGIFSAVYSMVQ